MKIVINKCYGGFSLSLEAQRRYAKSIGKNVYFYKQTKYKFKDGCDEYVKINNSGDKSLFVFSLFEDTGETTKELPNYNEKWLHDRDIARNDENLIRIVKELGDEASGQCAKLKIIEIPDGVDYEIEEYDGMEWVAEKHKMWG